METLLCLMFMYNTHQRVLYLSFEKMKMMPFKWVCCSFPRLYQQVKSFSNWAIFAKLQPFLIKMRRFCSEMKHLPFLFQNNSGKNRGAQRPHYLYLLSQQKYLSMYLYSEIGSDVSLVFNLHRFSLQWIRGSNSNDSALIFLNVLIFVQFTWDTCRDNKHRVFYLSNMKATIETNVNPTTLQGQYHMI